jgi:hypothetical protein
MRSDLVCRWGDLGDRRSDVARPPTGLGPVDRRWWGRTRTRCRPWARNSRRRPGTIRGWDARTFTPRCDLSGDRGAARALVPLPVGNLLVAVGTTPWCSSGTSSPGTWWRRSEELCRWWTQRLQVTGRSQVTRREPRKGDRRSRRRAEVSARSAVAQGSAGGTVEVTAGGRGLGLSSPRASRRGRRSSAR